MSQRLTLPFKDMRITAGYKHPQYLKEWGWPHYGVDCYDPNTHDVLALGDGEVIAAGQDGPTLTGNLSRLGMVTVIVYRDVLCSDGLSSCERRGKVRRQSAAWAGDCPIW